MEAFETIRSTAGALLSFVESYRKFTSVPKPEIRSFRLQAVVDNLIRLLSNEMEVKNIRTEMIFPEVELILNADENLVSQVILNILKNAIQAMDTTNGGTIIIRGSKNATGQLVLAISNSGPPIPEDILAHIFVPFFTTKETGTGIGLSVSRYIMRLHGGKLNYSVSPEGMPTFSLWFN